MAQYKVGDIDLSLSAFSKDAVASLDTVISKLTTMRTLTRDIAKDLRSISNVKVKAPTIANGDGTTLGEKTGNVTQMSEKSAKSIDTTKSKLRELAVQAGKTFAGIRERGGEAFGTLTKGIQKAGRALVRVAFYRVIRTVIKFVTDQVGAGLKSLSLVSTELQTAFAQLGVASSNFGNALALTIYPLIVAVSPYVQRLSEWLIDIANAFSYLAYQAGIVDKLFIASKGSIDEYNKALNKTTASYDKFEHLTGGNTLSGIGGFEEIDPNDPTLSPEKLALLDDMANKAEKLKGVLAALAALLGAIALIKVGNGILWLLTNGTSILGVLKWTMALGLVAAGLYNIAEGIVKVNNNDLSGIKDAVSGLLLVVTGVALMFGAWPLAIAAALSYAAIQFPQFGDLVERFMQTVSATILNFGVLIVNSFTWLLNDALLGTIEDFVNSFIIAYNDIAKLFGKEQADLVNLKVFEYENYFSWGKNGLEQDISNWDDVKTNWNELYKTPLKSPPEGESFFDEFKSDFAELGTIFTDGFDKWADGFKVEVDIDGEKVASATLPHTERLLERQGKEFAKKYS